jgi:DNA-directed RNA polymerase specialized sigma24 family protein
MTSDVPGELGASGMPEPDEVYRTLWGKDRDAIHDVVVTHGPGILARGRPYILRAAQNAATSRWRRDRRRSELEQLPDGTDAEQGADPAKQVEEDDLMHAVRAALDALPQNWLLVVWRRAEGRSYAQIADEWVQLGFGPRPTEAALRKAQQRAIERLRAGLVPAFDDDRGSYQPRDTS